MFLKNVFALPEMQIGEDLYRFLPLELAENVHVSHVNNI